MKANELRIGNLRHLGDGRLAKVTAIYLSGFHVQDENGIDHNNHQSNIKPIPLTEEWLLKFGFSDTGSGIYNLNGTLILYFKRDDEFSLMGYNSKRWQKTLILKFVHQLQNLYFALTGEELEIK